MAKALASQGANIVALAHRKEKLDQVVVDLKKEYDIDAYTIACDITNTEMVDNAVKEAMEHFGRIDILINNAGTGAVAPAVVGAPSQRTPRRGKAPAHGAGPG